MFLSFCRFNQTEICRGNPLYVPSVLFKRVGMNEVESITELGSFKETCIFSHLKIWFTSLSMFMNDLSILTLKYGVVSTNCTNVFAYKGGEWVSSSVIWCRKYKPPKCFMLWGK